MEFEQMAVKDNAHWDVYETFLEQGLPWEFDTVRAKGVIRQIKNYIRIENVAELRFNYAIFPGKEFELIRYKEGRNFLEDTWVGATSHYGVHVPQIDDYRTYLSDKGFSIVQEVVTIEHTNVPDDRHYHYAIFDHSSLEFHWKLIQRLNGNFEWNLAKADINKRYGYDIF